MAVEYSPAKVLAGIVGTPFNNDFFDDCVLCQQNRSHNHVGSCSECDMSIYPNNWWYDEEDPSYKYCPMSQAWANGNIEKWVDLMVDFALPELVTKHFPIDVAAPEWKENLRQYMTNDLTQNPSKQNKLRYLRYSADIHAEYSYNPLYH